MSQPQTIFGCATIGTALLTDKEFVLQLLRVVQRCGISHLDTAARYPPDAPGQSEKLLGEALAVADVSDRFTVDTKIKVLFINDGALGSLTPENIEASLNQSLKTLGLPRVDVLYCHAPDNKTPLEDQAAAFDKFHKQGLYNKLGVSNFTIEMLDQWLQICDEKGYIRPSVYQGQYSLFCRRPEERLLPWLRRQGIAFVGFSPLAGGFLTGKLTSSGGDDKDLSGTRFAPGNAMGKAFRNWYDKPTIHAAMAKFQVMVDQHGLSMTETALRWVFYHSSLSEADAVLLGSSRPHQVEDATRDIAKGPLSPGLAVQLDDLWDMIRDEAP